MYISKDETMARGHFLRLLLLNIVQRSSQLKQSAFAQRVKITFGNNANNFTAGLGMDPTTVYGGVEYSLRNRKEMVRGNGGG